MPKDHVFAVVKKHILPTIDGLAESDVDPSKSMKDLGAHSLEIVEIVSAALRELEVEVPHPELSKRETIGGLVDPLHDVSVGASLQ